AVGHGPDEVVVPGDSHGDVVGMSGLVLGQADRAVFGVGEAAAGHHVVSDPADGTADGVPGRDAAFEPGALDQLGAAVDVPGGEDVPGAGPQVVIDRDGSRAAGDCGGVKVEVLEVGGPADGGEGGLRRGAFGGAAAGEMNDDLLAAAFQCLDAGAVDDLDALGLERSAQRGGNAGIGAGHEPGAGFDEPDMGSQVGEDRGDLAAGVGSADDRDLLRKGFESPDVFIAECEIAARDRQRGRAAADRDDDAVRVPAAAVRGAHGVRAGEPDGAKVLVQVDPVVAQVAGDVLLVVGVARDPGTVGQDRFEVGDRPGAFQAEALPRGPVPGQPGGPGQGTDRRRPAVQAGPPDLPGF